MTTGPKTESTADASDVPTTTFDLGTPTLASTADARPPPSITLDDAPEVARSAGALVEPLPGAADEVRS